MVATLEMLQSGVVTLGKKFGDGSIVWCNATASPSYLWEKGLDHTKIYNLDSNTAIPLEEILTGNYVILEECNVTAISMLDKFINRGVHNEYFST